MIKETVTFSSFVDRFRDMGRENQFTYAGKRALFDYLEEFSDDTGEDIELDVIALCCEYSEYSSAIEAYEDYSGDKITKLTDETEEEAQEEAAREYFEEKTQVISNDKGVFIIAQF